MSTDALFLSYHQQAQPLVLANAWDAGSARLIESLGAKAIATSSAGVAWSLGYRDGDAIPLELHLAAAAAIFRVVTVPLSVDIESGYSDDPYAVGNAVSRFVDIGVVGINLQDGTGSPDLLAAKIEAAREAGERAGVGLYINARTDVYARGLASPGCEAAETLRRARLYENAGADGLFALALTNETEIRKIASESRLALNVVAWPGLPPMDKLAALGVKRLSIGSWLPQTLWAHTSRLVTALLSANDYGGLFAEAAPYGEVNQLFD